MTTHAETTHVAHDHAVDHAAAADGGYRFEKSELQDFVADDRTAGEAIGKLLALVFAVSLVLMLSVTIWSVNHQSQGYDPHTIVGFEENHEH